VRAWVCYLRTNPHDHDIYQVKTREFAELAKAAGYDVAGVSVQLRLSPHSSYMFGKGRLAELKEELERAGAEVAVFYNVLSSRQKHNITTLLKREVIDRYDLTLKIFEMASSDKLTKLQIRLASLEKAIPYEKLKASLMFRRGREHPGPMSLGEYAYHSTVANLYKMKASVKEEIETRRSERLRQLNKRKKLGIPTVCLAGYFNAGKTSLFNAFTGLRRDVRPTPFTTLASKYYMTARQGIPIFLVDTIGFAMDLDPRLIASFSLTLDDIRLADLILLVVDISDDALLLMLRTSTCIEILKSLGMGPSRLVVAANKIDRIDDPVIMERMSSIKALTGNCPVVPTSVKDGSGISDLANEISLRAREISVKPLVGT